MAIKKATTSIYIDKSYPKGEKKECAITIRVTYERKHKYYSTGYNLTVADFETILGKKLIDPNTDAVTAAAAERKRKVICKKFKKIVLDLQAKEKKAADMINDMAIFSFAAFEKRYSSNSATGDTISKSFDDYIKVLNDNEQLGTASSYECAKNSIESFRSGLKFSDVTSDFLYEYEKWMINNDRTKTTVGIYLRNLRSLINKAISDRLFSKDSYPFGPRKHGKYEIPKGSNTKKALSLPNIAAIYKYNSGNDSAQRMKNYWLFMYLSNGINMKDMCLLKYKNIKGNFIEFERAKTERTKRETKAIRVVLTDEIKAIIGTYGNKDIHPENYIFPILPKKITAARQRQLIQQITGVVNDHMKIIAADLKINSKATTYSARHSFATILQRSGVSVSFISEALGHSNVTTTQNYLAGFEDEKKIETVKALTAF